MTGYERPQMPIRREDDDVQGHGIKTGGADAKSAEGGDDTEGHAFRSGGADAETPEGEDVEGHGYKWADAERPEGDDTAGHALRGGAADAETAEGEQDTEGHGFRSP